MTKRSPRLGSTLAFLMFFLSLAGLSALGAPPLYAGANRWTPIGPTGGIVRVLAAAPSQQGTVYASVDGRMFRTDDAGTSWRELPPFAVDLVVVDIAVDSRTADTVYVASGSGVLKSIDGGRSWAASTFPNAAAELALAPSAPDTLYTIGYSEGVSTVFKSVDGAASWHPVPPRIAGTENNTASTVSVDPNDARSVYAGGYLLAGGASTVQAVTFHSSDGGATWARLAGAGGTPLQVTVDPTSRTTLYGSRGNGLFRSLDAGASWADIAPAAHTEFGWLAVDPLHPATIYASGGDADGDRLWRSDDRGDHWTLLPTRPSKLGAFALDPLQPARLYFGVTESGVDRSDDRGATWGPAGPRAASTGAVTIDPVHPATLYAATVGGGIVRSVDAGVSWRAVNDGLAVERPVLSPATGFVPGLAAVTRIVVDPQTSYVYAASDFGVYRSTDGGTTWSLGDIGPQPLQFVADLAAESVFLYAAGIPAFDAPAGSCGAAVRIGNNPWKTYKCGVSGGNAIAAVGIGPNGRVLAVVRDTLTVLTSDDGITLHPFGTGLPTLPPTAFNRRSRIVSDPLTPGTVYLSTDAIPDGIFRSTDSGAHWISVASSLPEGRVVEDLLLDPRVAGTVYIATDRGVFVSADRGTTWVRLNTGLTAPVVALAADPTGRTLVASSPAVGLSTLHRGACTDSDIALCVLKERFRVEVAWRAPDGTAGSGHALPLGGGTANGTDGPDTVGFWFFGPTNVDLVVKLIDGTAIADRFWVFYGALSNVAYRITVTDTATGAVKVYRNPQGHLASFADTAAFVGGTTSSDSALPTDRAPETADGSEIAATGAASSVDTAAATGAFGGCDPTRALCLGKGRFRAEVAWQDTEGHSGAGIPLSIADDTGSFWFFGPSNIELVLKVLDGNGVNGHFWVFFGALSDVAYTVTVTDTATGRKKTYTNPHGTLASVADTAAF